MKKLLWIVLSLSLLLVFAACGEETPLGQDGEPVAEQELVPLPEYNFTLEELPSGYDYEMAQEDGCVVFLNGDVNSGQELWDSFFAQAKAGKVVSIRLAEYDGKIVDPQLIRDLSFDGEAYILSTRQEDGSVDQTSYPYLRRYEEDQIAPNMPYEPFIRYTLVEEDVSWDKLFEGFGEEGKDASIAFDIVYTDLL